MEKSDVRLLARQQIADELVSGHAVIPAEIGVPVLNAEFRLQPGGVQLVDIGVERTDHGKERANLHRDAAFLVLRDQFRRIAVAHLGGHLIRRAASQDGAGCGGDWAWHHEAGRYI